MLEFLYTGAVSLDKNWHLFIDTAKELKIIGILDLGQSETPLEKMYEMKNVITEGAIEPKEMKSVASFLDVKAFLKDQLKNGADKNSDWMSQYEDDNLGAVKCRCIAGKKCQNLQQAWHMEKACRV